MRRRAGPPGGLRRCAALLHTPGRSTRGARMATAASRKARQSASRHPALTAIAASDKTKVKVAVTDIDGVLRGKYSEPATSSSRAARGRLRLLRRHLRLGHQRRPLRQRAAHRLAHGYPDAHARLDLDTHRNVPWDGDIDFFLVDFVTDDGKPHPICPRQTLKRVLARAAKLGLSRCAASSSSGSTSARRRRAGPKRRA